jgi:phosphoinositide-3-kinase regulatory subunit 4
MFVKVITPSNAAIFPEYIFPNLRHLVSDPEVFVRCIYAQSITHIADTAVRYLEMGQALRAHGAFKLSAEAQEYGDANFEVCFDRFNITDGKLIKRRSVMSQACPICSQQSKSTSLCS